MARRSLRVSFLPPRQVAGKEADKRSAARCCSSSISVPSPFATGQWSGPRKLGGSRGQPSLLKVEAQRLQNVAALEALQPQDGTRLKRIESAARLGEVFRFESALYGGEIAGDKPAPDAEALVFTVCQLKSGVAMLLQASGGIEGVLHSAFLDLQPAKHAAPRLTCT